MRICFSMDGFVLFVDDRVVKVQCGEDNTVVLESHLIKSIRSMREVLNQARGLTYGRGVYALHRRSVFSQLMEWRAHNLLYALTPRCFSALRLRLASVDLNTNNAWYLQVAYFVLGCLYPHF